jgi:hypothetical protein
MNTALARIFRLQGGEAAPLLVLGAVLFFNAVAMQVSGILSVSGFLDSVGVPGILIVWVIDFAVILAMSAVQSLIIDRIERARLVRIILLAFLAATVGLRLLFALGAPDALNYFLLYLLKDQQWLFLPAVFWVLASDIFSMSQSKRLFPVIAAFGLVGKLTGVVMSIFLPSLIAARTALSISDLLWINAALYAVAALLLTFGLRRSPARTTRNDRIGVQETLHEGAAFLRTVPMFRYLTIAILMLVVCETIVEFEFLRRADRSYDTIQNFAAFYATFRLVVIVFTIFTESVVTSRLIEKLQIKNTFLLLPSTFLLGTLGVLFSPGALSAIGAMLSTQIVKNVDDAAARSLRALVPEEKRGRVTLFMENYLIAAGTIAGSVIVGILLLIERGAPSFVATPIYLGLGALLAVFAIVAVVRVRALYETSLLSWKLTRRKRAADLLNKLDL